MQINNKYTIPLAAAALLVGGAITMAAQSYAETSTTTTSTTTNIAQEHPPQINQGTGQSAGSSMGGHIGTNGVREEILTGDTASKASASAISAVPGGTIQRVETDAEGAVYEAHMVKPDGTFVTVKMDANFNVTATEEGLQHK